MAIALKSVILPTSTRPDLWQPQRSLCPKVNGMHSITSSIDPLAGSVPAMKMKTFLVEDNPTIRENLISTLEELAPIESVGTAETAEEGVAWLSGGQSCWDLAIVDLFLKSGTGLRVLQACQGRPPCQKMVVFSNYATREMRLRCAELGADAIFDKSTEIDALLNYCQRQSENLARGK